MNETSTMSETATEAQRTIEDLHQFRKEIDRNIILAEAHLTGSPSYVREMALVRTKLQEAKMWVGKCLEVLGSELPKEYRDKAE